MMINAQRIRDLLLEGTLGVSGNTLTVDFDEPDAPRALVEEILALMDYATEQDIKREAEAKAARAWDDWRDSLVTPRTK
ncbi:MAG: hypothetical protein DI537_37950 [Stutzerimonas stutzeri]|nr:MAG: hypothetical protein DI537_37950 [Stutzerimonas stutzeri]